MESRGFVENSFIAGIRPAEFFFHAMGGREGLIDTAVKTSDSGYIQRKLVKTMEDLHVEYDGTVRNVNGGVIQYHYGGDGIDSVCVERVDCPLGTMTMEQIYRDFALAPGDLSAVLQKDTDDIPDNVDQILKDRDVLVKNVLRYNKKEKVSSPVNFKRLAQKYRNNFSVKTDLTPRYVVDELTKLCDSKTVRHNKLFQILLRFYLSPKKAIVDLRLTRDLFDELLKEIAFKYTKSVVHAGEMVGTLGAQSIGEPTTQLTLNTFHSAGTAKANATAGVPRIIELLSVSHNPKNPSNTVYLDPSIAGSQDSAIYKAKEIQKTTLRDITKSVRIYYDPNPLSSNSLIQEDRDILQSYEKFSVTQGQCASPWIMRLELDRQEMAARQVVDLPLVRTKIENNKILKVFDCIHSDTNAPDKLVMRIVFGADTVKNALSLRFIEDKLLDTVLTGVDGIGRVFPREVTNQLLWDEKMGCYTATKQYVLDVEGTNLLDLSVLPNIDPFRTFSDDIHEILDVFGIETVRVALYEEFAGVLEAADGVDYHHLMMLVDAMTYPGFVLQVDRFGMNKNTENGVLAKSSFEETSKILFNAALAGDFDNMKGVSANIMFGQKPPCGTGFVDILIDETKLPEGTEEDNSVFEAERNAVNLLVEQEQTRDDVVNMADILME
jgi:DNA-directed RNA polymerase II subunit RPB1